MEIRRFDRSLAPPLDRCRPSTPEPHPAVIETGGGGCAALVPVPRPGGGDTDPVVDALNAALRLACAQPEQACSLFVDSVHAAIKAHLALAQRAAVDATGVRLPRLTRWQERRAKEFLATNAAEDVSIASAALACKLSRSYFIRAFRNTTGETPHRWLNRYRVEKAKELLLGRQAIAEIATECGFADQSHLTRVFAKTVGLPPGSWRREYRDAAGTSLGSDLRLAGTAA